MTKQKIYELTTNGKDGYSKWYVRGIETDEQAQKIALRGFGKKYYWEKGITYYDDDPSINGNDWSRAFTKESFIKQAKKRYMETH